MNLLLSFHGKPVYYIDNEILLRESVAEIALCTEIGLDTEFDKNRNSYGFNVCVIQVSTPDAIYIIDPIKIGPKENYAVFLKPFFDIVSSPRIVKIIHACTEDIRLFAKYGCTTQNIFDTKIAAKVLGIPTADSYKGVLKEVLHIELDKSLQSINWLKRPLKQDDLAYLAGDVFYLKELKEKLLPELTRVQRMSWFDEETALALDFNKTTDFDYDMTNIKAKVEYRNLSEYNKALFDGFWKFRGEYAKELNVPPYYIYSDEAIFIFLDQKLWDMDTAINGLHKRLLGVDKKRWINYINGVITVLNEQKLSKEPPEKKYMSSQEKAINTHKLYHAIKVFTPIQQYFTEQYGDTISKYLLSKTTVGKVAVAGNCNILPQYVINEIRKAADITGAEIKEYLT